MAGTHIYLPRMDANTVYVITTSLRTFILPTIKVDSPVTKSKIYSSRVQKKQMRNPVLRTVTTDERA
jgi:hypothetical protein